MSGQHIFPLINNLKGPLHTKMDIKNLEYAFNKASGVQSMVILQVSKQVHIFGVWVEEKSTNVHQKNGRFWYVCLTGRLVS